MISNSEKQRAIKLLNLTNIFSLLLLCSCGCLRTSETHVFFYQYEKSTASNSNIQQTGSKILQHEGKWTYWIDATDDPLKSSQRFQLYKLQDTIFVKLKNSGKSIPYLPLSLNDTIPMLDLFYDPKGKYNFDQLATYQGSESIEFGGEFINCYKFKIYSGRNINLNGVKTFTKIESAYYEIDNLIPLMSIEEYNNLSQGSSDQRSGFLKRSKQIIK
jgi:hypothetical protein